MKVTFLHLTCANQPEAEAISTVLLKKRLVACIKMIPITSKFLWQGSIESAQEVLLIMDSEESNFMVIEQEVRKLHSYSTFVLISTSANKLSTGVAEWIQESLQL